MIELLTVDLQRYVEEKIRTGKYESTQAVLVEAVRQMKQYEERVAWLGRELQFGIDQLEKGQVAKWDLEQTKERLAARSGK